MPEWTVCPHCQLRHSRRGDGLCPRCRSPLAEAAPPAESAAAGAHQPPPTSTPDVHDGRPVGGSILFPESSATAREEVGLGVRLGGAVLVANGLALLVQLALSGTKGETKEALHSFTASPISMLIDLVLGGMLVAGNPKGLPWAKFRVVAGGLVLPIVFFAQGQGLVGGLQIVFSGGLALLLFGEAGRLRLASGLLAAASVFVLNVVGMIAMASGTDPLARALLSSTLERQPVYEVEGLACPYHITAGGGRWYLRRAEAARKDNPLADRWLVWPEKDAHVLVIVERLEPGLVIDMDKFAEAVLTNARRAASDLSVVGREPLPRGGALLHTRGTTKGMAIESYFGLFAQEPWAFQVFAFASQGRFDSVKTDLGSIVASFEPPRP